MAAELEMRSFRIRHDSYRLRNVFFSGLRNDDAMGFPQDCAISMSHTEYD